MAPIPVQISTLSTALQRSPELKRVLIAAILHSEDEVLVITQSELRAAFSYDLIVTDVSEEDKAVALTVRSR